MSLSNLPDPIDRFLAAIQASDDETLLTTFADDVVLDVDGLEIAGKAAVQAWFSRGWTHWPRPPRAINDARQRGILVLTMLVAELGNNQERLVHRTWSLIIRHGLIARLRCEPNLPLALPGSLAAFVEAANTSSLDRLVEVFHSDAIVNDQLQVYRGTAAIREWAAREIIGAEMTIHPVSLVEAPNCALVAANVNGLMIEAGMPDPLVLSFYFGLFGAEIVSLIILPDLSNG